MIRYLTEGWILIDTATETMWGTTVFFSRKQMLEKYAEIRFSRLFKTVKPLRKKQRITVEDIKK